MPYDVTTIGSLVAGTCTCGGRKGLAGLEPTQIAGLWDTLNEVGEKLTPGYWVKRGVRRVEQKIDAARSAVGDYFDPLPVAIDVIGVPTWGFEVPTYLKGAAVVAGVVAVGVVGYKVTKGSRSRSRR